ncbi:hypothetical protein V9T40_005733 [Parthenolecanium corni]|uniref:RRM domain-containing protein n=1 Tax=Parthenolecanium corni TaxID=536013 RepID=A0AAN9YB12_9HEMI
MKDSREELPPYSKLFVLHGKNTSKQELQDAFEKFGKIQDLWMVRDRESQELKGVSYVKYSKMSEAALAIERMNGTALPSNPRPLKVIIASSREEGYRKDDDIDRFMRLFIVVPRDGSEDEDTLRKYFQDFGDVESVNILRNRETHESKGFAYVKFTKIYDAAKALEECDTKYRAVLAKPKEKREQHNYPKPPSRDYNERHDRPSNSRHAELCEGYASDQGYTRVSAFISTQLSEDLALKLFDLVPGLAYARLTDDMISHRTQKMWLEYDTPEAAAFAVDRLNGFEYPIGEPIMLKPDTDWKRGPSLSSRVAKSGPSDRKRDHTGYQKRSPGPSSSHFCSAPLPPVQPTVTGEEGDYRLFVVFQPEAPPLAALRDVFCRFGDFVDCHLIPGKNYGYAYYVSEAAAHQAIQLLHGQELLGNRMKVMEAEPRLENKRSRRE